MTNINKVVWDYIDNRVEIKKSLIDGLINTSALARRIADDEGLMKNIDAIISAIRRYEGRDEKKKDFRKIYEYIKQARISSKTKLASILIKRSNNEEKLGQIYTKVPFKRGSTLRIFEVTNFIKIITDEELLMQIQSIFLPKEIEAVERGLGELTIDYVNDVTKVSGVFAALANELAINEISIIDSMICQWEHLIFLKEEDLEKAFAVVFNLTKGKN